MREIAGEKYRLAGIGVAQKGTLVDVFAKFCGINEDLAAIRAEDAKPKEPKVYPEGSAAAILNSLTPIPKEHTLPSLSTQDIVEAIVGRRETARSEHMRLHLSDTPGVIKDLGPEKLAEVLVEMGKVRKQVLEEGFYTVVENPLPVKEAAPEVPMAAEKPGKKADKKKKSAAPKA